MFGSVKKWLGIEGVKVELIIPEVVREADGKLNGKLRFFSKNEQTVTSIRIVMIEKYKRGHRSAQKVDEYDLGEIKMRKKILVPAESPIEVDFVLPFSVSKSEMDEMGDQNILLGGIAKAAKWLQGVQSDYRVEVYTKVAGVALDPFDRKSIAVE